MAQLGRQADGGRADDAQDCFRNPRQPRSLRRRERSTSHAQGDFARESFRAPVEAHFALQ